jgi:HD-like signal output (HDOD) protein
MVAKVLQLVNSAYFGLRNSVTSVRQAVRYLGLELLTGLLLTARVFSLYDRKAANGFSVERLHDHSLRAAQASRLILQNHDAQEETFTAALLHDVGQLVLAVGVPDQYEKLTREAQQTKRPLFTLEQNEFGVSHAEVGAYLLGVWGLPFSMVEAVAYHHRPNEVTVGQRDMLAVLHTVDALVDLEPNYEGEDVPGLDKDFLASGPWLADLPRWRSIVCRDMIRATETKDA